MTRDPGKRKLTTIMAADVVGYSKMMADDEETTLHTLKAYRVVMDELITKHGGSIFNTAGDAVLAEFGSAVEAVRCAVSIQEDLRIRNSQLPRSSEMWFRIGVNVGDVLVDENDLFGDGVNVAARLEGLAEKGGICISGSTFDQVKNKLSIAFDDIGAQKVKNIPEPIPAFRLVPGKVTVNSVDSSAVSEISATRPSKHSLVLTITGASASILIVAGAYMIGLPPFNPTSSHSYDGYWKVNLSSLSGCRNNHARSFIISVENGIINAKDHPLPKTGSVTEDGKFSITVTDAAGNFRASQTGTIVNDRGEGRFEGKKPSCGGKLALERLN